MEKQMTDKEIIKALEFCGLLDDECLCKICPYFDVDYCGKALVKDTLDLINRQQEMLEAAANGQETLQKALAEKDKEIERLKNELRYLTNERDLFLIRHPFVDEAIDNLADKMVGEG